MAYGDFKDLARRTTSDKVLRNKAFNIAKNPKYDGYQRGHAPMVYNFFDIKTSGTALNLCKIKILQMKFINQVLKKN